jgi:hypothetical protein
MVFTKQALLSRAWPGDETPATTEGQAGRGHVISLAMPVSGRRVLKRRAPFPAMSFGGALGPSAV